MKDIIQLTCIVLLGVGLFQLFIASKFGGIKPEFAEGAIFLLGIIGVSAMSAWYDFATTLSVFSLAIAIYLPVFIERIQKPLLFIDSISITQTPWSSPDGIIEWFWSLGIKVVHQPLPGNWAGWWANLWLERKPAQNCKGTLTFINENTNERFPSMEIRWAGSPQPTTPQALLFLHEHLGYLHEAKADGQGSLQLGEIQSVLRLELQRGWLTRIESSVTIDPGRVNTVDVVVQFDDDENCYGWNNESYFVQQKEQNKVPRNQHWRLPSASYIVELHIVYSDRTLFQRFRLMNTGNPKELKMVALD